MNNRWRRWFGWSKSRAALFRECPKRYSFQYLFKFESGDTAAMAKILSKLGDLPIQKGILVHQEIETFLRIHERQGREDREESLRRLRARFDTQIAGACQNLREVRLLQMTLEEARERLRQDQSDALRQLETFLDHHWPRLRENQVVCFERLERFSLREFSMWVSADLVLRTPDRGLLLVDWKTGLREHDADDSEQLTGYILWAHREFGVPVEAIEAELVWLASGRVDRTRREEVDLEALEAQIVADCLEMLSLKSYSQVEARPEESRCRRCPFLPLCREGGHWMPREDRQEVLADLRHEIRGESEIWS